MKYSNKIFFIKILSSTGIGFLIYLINIYILSLFYISLGAQQDLSLYRFGEMAIFSIMITGIYAAIYVQLAPFIIVSYAFSIFLMKNWGWSLIGVRVLVVFYAIALAFVRIYLITDNITSGKFISEFLILSLSLFVSMIISVKYLKK